METPTNRASQPRDRQSGIRESGTRRSGLRRKSGAALLAILTVALFAIGVERSATRGNDFDNFYDAAASVWTDGELLNEKGTARYLPSFQVMVSPLGALPIEAAAIVWILLDLAAYAALVWLLARLGGVSPTAQVPAWLAVAPFVVGNVTLGQNGPILLALSTAGIWAAAVGRERLGGAALAAAGLLKVFPAALLVVPAMLGRARGALHGALLATAAVALWMALALGPGAALDGSLRWLGEIREEQTPARFVEVVRGLRYNNQSLAIVLARTFGDFSVQPRFAAPGSTQLLALPLAWVWAAWYAILAAMLATIAAVAWRLHRLGRHPAPPLFLGVFALSIPAMLAASPLVWTHYFLWLLPGFVYLADRRRTLAVVAVVSLAAVFSRTARGLGFHMALTLLQFAWIARDLWKRSAAEADHAARAAPSGPPSRPAVGPLFHGTEIPQNGSS